METPLGNKSDNKHGYSDRDGGGERELLSLEGAPPSALLSVGAASSSLFSSDGPSKSLLSSAVLGQGTASAAASPAPPSLPPKKVKLTIPVHVDIEGAPSEEASARDRTIDEMKVQTMFKMVEDVSISLDGRMFEKKLLYLTNKQCSMFDETGILRCIQALDLGEPKCIIRLMFSGGSSYLYKANAQAHVQRLGQWGTYTLTGGNINAKDDNDFTQQAIMLMRNCIIPLAKETRALIVINASTNCLLGNVLAEVAIPEQERLGKNCPFKVLGFLNGNPFMTYNAVKGIGVAGDLASGSPIWQSRIPAALQHFGEQAESDYFRVNANKAASHYIVFECIDFDTHPSKINYNPPNRFQTLLASALSRNLPSVAFCCSNGASNGALVEVGGNDWDVTSSMLKVGVPVLFLDLRLRAFSCKRIDPALTLPDLCIQADQFPRMSSEDLKKIKFGKDGFLSIESRKFFLKTAFRMLENHHECILANNSFDRWFYSTFAFLFSALTVGTVKVNANEHLPLYECIATMRSADAQEEEEGLIPQSLVMKAVNYLMRRLPVQARLQRKHRLENWLKDHSPNVNHLEGEANKEYQTLIQELSYYAKYGGMEPDFIHQQVLSVSEMFLSGSTYVASLYDLNSINRIIRKVAKIDRLPDSNSLEANLMIRDAWDHVDLYHINANTYKQITKLTYLCMLLLGIFTTALSISYSCGDPSVDRAILYTSLCGSVIAAFYTFVNPAVKWQQLRGAALSIESLIWQYRTRTGIYRVHGDDFEVESLKNFQENVQSVKDFVNDGAGIKTSSFFGSTRSPNLHGQHQPSNAPAIGTDGSSWLFSISNDLCSVLFTDPIIVENPHDGISTPIKTIVEDNIWSPIPKTHTAPGSAVRDNVSVNLEEDVQGIYPLNVSVDEDGSASLVDVLQRIEEVSGSLKSDNLTRIDSNCKDHHYLPVHPENYCSFRIKREIDFYKSRIPKYNKSRYVGQTLMMLGTVSSSVMAVSKCAQWAALAAICTSSVTAWQEFQSTNDKITRYSTTVANLQKLLLWWKTCQPIEKASTEHVDKLVRSAEEALKSDRDAWGSTSEFTGSLGKLLSENSKKGKHGKYY